MAPSLLLAQHREEHAYDRVIPPKRADLALSAAEQEMLDETNRFRLDHHLSPLAVNPHLEESARYFADYMAGTGHYGHEADGHRPSERDEAHGYDYCIADENIAWFQPEVRYQPRDLAHQFMIAWEQSPHHRENLLDPEVVDIGLALACARQTGTYYAVQELGRPKSMAFECSVTNHTDAEMQYQIARQQFELRPRYTRTHYLCRPAKLRLLPLGSSKASTASIEIENGGHYVASARSGRVELQRGS